MVQRPLFSSPQPAACGLQPTFRVLARLVLLVLLLAAAGPAQAETKADDLLQEGKRLYSLAQFEQALGVFQRAVVAGAGRVTLAQVHLYKGLCEAELGDKRKARKSLGAALDLAPDLALGPRKFKRSACKLLDQVRKSRRGRLRVEADQAGAVVKLDGKEVGTVPFEGEVPAGAHQLVVVSADGSLGYSGKIMVQPRVLNRMVLALKRFGGLLSVYSSPRGAEILVDGELTSLTPVDDIALAAGVHEVTVRLLGYLEQTRTIELRAGQQVRLDLELKREVPAQEGAAQSDATRAEGQPRSIWSRKRVWTWVALGAAGASAIAAGAVWGSAKSDHDEYLSTSDIDRFYELESQIDDKLLASNIMWGVTGALGATAVVLFFLEGRQSSKSSYGVGSTAGAFHMVPVVGPSPGIVLDGRF